MTHPPRLMGFLLGLLLLTTRLAAQSAGRPVPGKAANQPDVLVLVFAVPGGPDQIGLTYPGVVPHAQAMRDVNAIAAATGWNISGVHIADQAPPIQKPSGKMTGVDFVAPGAVSLPSRYLPVEPFVNSLRSYRHVTLTYLVGGGFGFEGLRSYADNHVRIALDQSGSSYTYQIFYRDGRFGHISLPHYQLPTVDSRSSAAPETHRRGRLWLVALIAVAAVGAGCIAYAVLARNV